MIALPNKFDYSPISSVEVGGFGTTFFRTIFVHNKVNDDEPRLNIICSNLETLLSICLVYTCWLDSWKQHWIAGIGLNFF